MRQLIAVMLFLVISGCNYQQNPDEAQIYGKGLGVTYKSTERFKIERVGVFKDNLAYDDRRGIYVITDTDTNQQFIGVSGVGISELAAHQSGKTRLTDER